MKATIELVNEAEIERFAQWFAGRTAVVSTTAVETEECTDNSSTPSRSTAYVLARLADKAVEDVAASEEPEEVEVETAEPEAEEPETVEPAPTVSKTDVLAATKDFVKSSGSPALKKKLDKFGIANLGELQPERYGEFLAALETEDA